MTIMQAHRQGHGEDEALIAVSRKLCGSSMPSCEITATMWDNTEPPKGGR